MSKQDVMNLCNGRPPRIQRLYSCRRSGLATAWLLMFGPVFIVVLYTALEFGHIYTATTELKNALEASALAGVKAWKDNGTAATSIARDYAEAYALSNTVSGVPLVLDRNEGGGVNGNAACQFPTVPTANIVLGEVDGTHGAYIFDPNSPPGAISNVYVDLKIQVQTDQDTFNDANPDSVMYSFSVYDFVADDDDGTSPPGNDVDTIEIASVSINVNSVGGGTNGFFDLRDKTGGGGGLGPDKNNGIEPSFNGSDVGDTLGTDFTYSPLFVPGVQTTTSNAFSVNFLATSTSPFDPNLTDKFEWAVDTDDIPPPQGGKDEVDFGGDFAGADVTVVFRDSGSGETGSITGNLVFIDEHTARIEFEDEPLGGGSYGVRTQITWPVTPLCSSLLGLPLSDYNVTGEATALFASGGTEPELIRVVSYLCP